MIKAEYAPPFHGGTVADHRMGGMVMMAFVVVWLGRRHFGWVFSRLWSRATDPESRAARKSAIMFLAGCLGVCAWFCWARVPVLWAVALTAFGAVIALLRESRLSIEVFEHQVQSKTFGSSD